MPRFKNKVTVRIIQRVSLTLFFCLVTSLVSAATPMVGTISPSSGSTAPNIAKTFTTTYSDTDGWTNLKETYLLISTSSTNLTNSVYLYYDQNTNLFYLRDDGNTSWLGGYAPGSTNTIENSFVKLNCTSTTISGSGTTLTVKWNITFKPTYSGKSYSSYLKVVDDTGGYADWTQKGTYIVNYNPTVGTISPSSGSTIPDVAKTFTCNYSDTDGWTNLKEAYLLISTSSTTLTNSIYLYYDQNTNLLYLRDDTNSTWLGGYAPGSSNIIENSSVKLNCSLTTVSGSTNTLTINWNITFKSTYSGKTYNSYLAVKDDTGSSIVLTKKGTYTVNNPPSVGTITPASGTGQVEVEQTFTTTYSDADGWQNIQYVHLLMNTSTSGNNCLYAYYNQNTNLLYLRNDANSAWLGGYTPGSSNIIENSYAKLNCATTSASGSGTTLTVNWSVTIKAPFTGTKNTYLYVKDDVSAYAGWTQKGTWTIPNQVPSVGTISPSSGTSNPNQAVTFTSTYSDPDGWLNIQEAYLLINTYVNGANCFYAYYHPVNNKLYLRNDANSSWLGGYAPGSSNIISNTYVSLDCSKTTVSGSSVNLSINWSVTFKDKFSSRTNNSYLYVKDNAGKYQGWTQKGTWTILSTNPQNKIPLEAELATLVNPFTLGSDTNASSGQYIQILNGSGSNTTSPGGPGIASFTFDVPTEDTYGIWARVITPSTSDNSFFIQVDSGTVRYWDIPVGSSWSWVQVRDSTIGTFYARLTPGTHTLYFRQREDGTKLDKVILINDPLFVPGPEDVTGPDTTPPQITSVTPTDGSTFYESDTIVISPTVNDTDPSPLEYQFSIDGIIKQAWSSLSSYSWITSSQDKGSHNIKVEVKDVGGQDSKQVGIYIFRKPIEPPPH